MAVKKYFKTDSEKGYLENKHDINYFATKQMGKIVFGGMLGDFDENGFYVINQKIVEELIKMPKVIVDMVDGADLIRSKIKFDGFYHFILTVEENTATFSLLEKLQYQSNYNFNSGAYSNINEYVLDQISVPDKDFDRNSLYQKYNISVVDEGDSLSVFDMDELSIAIYFNIIDKIKMNYLTKNQLILKEKEIENVEADYFESVLELLTEFPDIENKVKEDVKNNLNEKRNLIIPNKPFFQKTVNEILDSSLDQFVYTLPSEQRDELLNKLREIKEKYYAEFKQIIPIQINQETGVRFNPIQIEDESIIASLAQQISTKSYTTSDIRKVVINKDDLALTLQKIKEMVEENEKLCIANNTSNSHIIKGRKLVKEFYEDWEKSKTNLLKSAVKQDVKEEENLISTVIKTENVKEKVASNKDNGKKKQVESSRSSSTTKGKSSGNKVKSSNSTKANNKVNKNQTNNEANKNQSKSSTNQTKTSNEFIGGTVGGFGGEKQEVDLLRKSIAVSERLRERRKASNKDVGGGLEL